MCLTMVCREADLPEHGHQCIHVHMCLGVCPCDVRFSSSPALALPPPFRLGREGREGDGGGGEDSRRGSPNPRVVARESRLH